MDNLIQTIAVYALPVLFAITLHEAAHGYVARYFGDPTAAQAGRISLNPLRHIDPMGTIVVPLVLLFATKLMGGGLLFGWAKPVPVNWSRLRRPKRDMLWVALAGPASNLLMAIGWVLFLRALLMLDLISGPQDFWALMASAGVQVNLILMALNLLPLPPLDGGRIVFSLLPPRLAWRYGRIEPYGLVILVVLMMLGWLWPLMLPLLKLGQWVVGGFL
ncbi:site-2 protease family protein [Castellaniella daejeonensis]|uniref:Site-2 protease family protein n=1 Tax=Castellaniella daejeonensis TaxID=659013 RepID=A0ABN0U071_9BURK|nr:site-2 protease family protein [Castellaniella sp.]HET8704060.1 site-2 protease family protein [Castellaniella sp.]